MKYTLDNDELQEAINVLITAHEATGTSLFERFIEKLLTVQWERAKDIVQK